MTNLTLNEKQELKNIFDTEMKKNLLSKIWNFLVNFVKRTND